MLPTALTTIVTTGFTVALIHAAIPTHWLPFVLVGRARQWSRPKILLVTLTAGLGHVLLTSALGLVVAWCGFQIDATLERAFPWMAGGLLLAIGGYYSWRQIRGTGICGHTFLCKHHHRDSTGHDECIAEGGLRKDAQKDGSPRKGDDSAAISGLFLMLTLSPCEGFLPLYLSGVQFGWSGFFILSATLAVATLSGMLLFTYFSLVGMEEIKFPRLERYDAGLLGAVFSLLGVLVLVVEH